jgi:hypothetical protein
MTDSIPSTSALKLPGWGPLSKSARLRIRVPKSVFSVNEKIRFFLQVEYLGKNSDIFWINEGKFKSNVLAEIDGKKEEIGSSGIMDGHVFKFPFQREITLAYNVKPNPGKHKLQLSLEGDGGIYVNLRKEKLRKFNGIIKSNVVEFFVEDK